MTELGFGVIHTYGLSKTYGPSTVCAWLGSAHFGCPCSIPCRQGVRYIGMEILDVVDLNTMKLVPADAKTLGKIVFRGNMVVKGYLKNPKANEEAFRGGWYHSGDLGVKHPDNYIEVKDRTKDIIISCGENISSLEDSLPAPCSARSLCRCLRRRAVKGVSLCIHNIERHCCWER